MSNRLSKALNLVKQKEIRLLSYKLIELIPYSIFRYNNFYIVYCNEIKKRRPLGKDYKIVVKDFSYNLIKKIKKELPQDLETVYYRARKREDKTHTIYIKHLDKIVASLFVLVDSIIVSPSGYNLVMDKITVQVYGVYVDPEYRLKGLNSNMVMAAYDLSRRYGQPGLYAEIQYMNKDSLLSFSKLGFEIYKNIKYIQLFGNKIFFQGRPGYWFKSK